MNVTIEITYSSPGTYPVYSPPNYRAASSVTLKCVASGYSGSISYHWTSTCSNCFASNSYSQTISDGILQYYDAGVHTCSVTDGLGNTGSNSTTMRIVGRFAFLCYTAAVLLINCSTFYQFAGIGIYVSFNHAHSTHTSSNSGGGVQSSNSFATVHTTTGYYTRLSLWCYTNSSSRYVGSFTFPNGAVRTSHVQPAYIYRYYSGLNRLLYRNSSQNSFTLSPDAVGIYTCTRPDSEGNLLQEHIGIYNAGFNSK